jgi:hypothetical protein
MEHDGAPVFAPADYLNDEELERILPKLSEEAGFAHGNFIDERHLDTDVGLVEQTRRHEADKAEEWCLVTRE